MKPWKVGVFSFVFKAYDIKQMHQKSAIFDILGVF